MSKPPDSSLIGDSLLDEPLLDEPLLDEPLLVIVGATASGKSALALRVAEQLGGEIVSADAVAVYQGLDIGSDKPDQQARRRVPHHLIDVARPEQRYSAGRFVADADAAIAEIRARGRLPVVVGGTLFYVKALLEGLAPLPPRSAAVKARLAAAWATDPGALAHRLCLADPLLAARIGPRDRQRILRALEVYETTGAPLSEHWRRQQSGPRYRALLVAPKRSRAELYARIELRVDRMFASGLVLEVRQLLAAGVPREAHALTAIGYRQIVAALNNEHDLPAAVARTKQSTRRLAKSQLRWLRRFREGRVMPVPPVEENGAATILELWALYREGSETI